LSGFDVSNSNALTELSNSGAVLPGTAGVTWAGGLALDGSGSPWVATDPNGCCSFVAEYSTVGSLAMDSEANSGGIGVGVDGSGDVWYLCSSGVVEYIGAGSPVITPIAAGLPATPTANGTSNLGTRP
jgi:hypothetical protein